MLVVEDRNRASVLAKDVGHLLEEFVARILLLTVFVPGIVAVLSDDQHGIDRQFVASAPQSLGNGRVNRKAKLFRTFHAEVVLRPLINIRGDHIQGRSMPATVGWIADQKALRHVPGVRVKSPLGRDDGQSFASGGRCLRRHQLRSNDQS